MDILISSNLERLLFELQGRDGEKTAVLMKELAGAKRYAIGSEALAALQRRYACGWAGEDEVRGEIRRMWNEQHYLMDTHTAVASAVLGKYRAEAKDDRRTVIVSTASPYKFGPAVLSAVGGEDAARVADDFACCECLQALTGWKEPDAIRLLPGLPVRHTAECAKEEMADAVLRAVQA